MSKLLKNPPLIEVACEVRFKPDRPWDWLVPSKLYEHFSDRVPIREAIPISEVAVTFQSGAIRETESPIRMERVAMLSEDRALRVQVGHDRVAVNHAQPYPGWDVFIELVMELFSSYVRLSESGSVDRIGLRYINEIALSQGATSDSDLVDIGSIITTEPPIPESIDRPIQQFVQDYVLLHEDENSFLRHRTATRIRTNAQDTPSLTLDLDFFTHAIDEFSADNIQRWLTIAHDRIGEAFIASVNPDVLSRMEEGD